MNLEEKITTIINKIRKLFGPRYKDILYTNPEIRLKYNSKNNKCSIESIRFNWWDSIWINSEGIWLHPEHGPSNQLMKFNNLEDFLEM